MSRKNLVIIGFVAGAVAGYFAAAKLADKQPWKQVLSLIA